ncbi:ABC transporter permease subunit [Clostridium sp. MCC353]|uniref:carbohydrate ABC transporter permease n=1 Tax=Clostridium sp. MCC353 TaxID=2592646 RepID=UPI001C00E826|nr:sugar ABC transporter permease [Clostridium sp. MCC353]MBT9775528.1 ABC transporter permease subunit [Clostridium sp. MCC353]
MKNKKNTLPKEYTVRHNLNGYLLIAPAVIAIIALSVYPLLRGIFISFLNYDMTRANDPMFGTFAGLKNYAVVFSNAKYRQSVSNSIIWTLVNLVAQVSFALIVALVLNEKLKGRAIFRTVALLPWAIPAAISALTFSALYDTKIGIFNVILLNLGIIEKPIAWLGNVSTAMPSVIVANIWKSTPFLMIFILAALQGVSHDMYESASIDGAGKLKRFLYITMPNIKEPMAVAVILNAISIFNNFNAIWLLTQGGPLGSTEIMYTFAYRQAFVDHKFGYAAAVSVVIFIVIAILTVIYVKMIGADKED